jgi:hypothetical protein
MKERQLIIGFGEISELLYGLGYMICGFCILFFYVIPISTSIIIPLHDKVTFDSSPISYIISTLIIVIGLILIAVVGVGHNSGYRAYKNKRLNK